MLTHTHKEKIKGSSKLFMKVGYPSYFFKNSCSPSPPPTLFFFLTPLPSENEYDILRLNDVLDLITIIYSLIFIIKFYFVFILINFSNLYFWIKKISVPLSKIMGENDFSSPSLEIFSDLFPLFKQ